MKFTTSIIHLARCVDRQKLINDIRRHIPDSKIVNAFEPTWEEKQDVRSIRGSSVSHLLAFEAACKFDIPHLVLEDDAVVNQSGLRDLVELDCLPDDCGILLVGSETPFAYEAPSEKMAFWEVRHSFHGAHGVLYNTPKLKDTKFLEVAWKCLSTNHMADSSCCYEGLLATALETVGLRAYRLNEMAFTTDPSIVSLRTGKPVHQRSLRAASDGPAPQEVKKESPIPFYKQ